MRALLLTLAVILLLTLAGMGVIWGLEQAVKPEAQAGEVPYLETNQELVTLNTVRIGSDNPIETAVAVSQLIYPVTEEENSPGAVVLVNGANLAEVMVATSRVQHFPVNAPILYVSDDTIPELTRNELLRLEPEGVAADGNVQVYLVGAIGDSVRTEVESLGFKTRVLYAETAPELAEVVDNWTSVQHGDHRNEIVIANLDNLDPAIPSAFWNAHRGDGLAFVTDDEIPAATLRMIERRFNGPWFYLFGDESVISDEIARRLAQYGQVTRIDAPDIAGTSAFFAGFHDEGKDWGAWVWQKPRAFGWGIHEAGHNVIIVNVDGPGGWQNVLPATTLSHMGKHAPVLAVNRDGLPEPVRIYLEATKPSPSAPQQQLLNHGWIIGGEETVSWQTQTEIDLLLDAYITADALDGAATSLATARGDSARGDTADEQ